MAARVDLNADLGELPGAPGAALDAELLAVVTSANVACGGHAGDHASMVRVAAAARRTGAVIGAHVSYPDRENFGRRPMALSRAELLPSLRNQVEALLAAVAEAGTTVRYLKAHGALYTASATTDPPAEVLVALAEEYALPVLTMPGGVLAQRAAAAGHPVFSEFFADRAYEQDGSLRLRSEAGALISDVTAVVRRTLAAVREASVTSHDGIQLTIRPDSVCVHGDTPGAVGIARRIRDALAEQGVALHPFTRRDP